MLHQTMGDYDAARLAAARLVPLASASVSSAMLCSIESHAGALEESYQRLRKTMAGGGTLGEERVWGLGILGDMAARLARWQEAARWYRQGLQTRPEDPLLVAGLADVWLERRDYARLRQVANPLRTRPALALRIAMADAAQGVAGSEETARLGEWFAAGRRSGHRHEREEAMFRLRVTAETELGLSLALRNWDLQREPVDARLVLEGALAAGDPDAARPVLVWLDKTRLEDVRLAGLRRRIDAAGSAPHPQHHVLSRQAIRIEYPCGWDELAEELHAWLVKELEKPGPRSALRRLARREDAVVSALRRELGLEHEDELQRMVLRESLRTMEVAAAFPDVRNVQLWDRD